MDSGPLDFDQDETSASGSQAGHSIGQESDQSSSPGGGAGDRRVPGPPPQAVTHVYHSKLTGKLSIFSTSYIVNHSLSNVGQICDANGNDLPPNTPPPPQNSRGPDDWTPYRNQVEFELADFLYRRNQMSAGGINTILGLWAESLARHGEEPPFSSASDMYKTIDSTPLGDVAWESFNLQYSGALPPGDNVPTWMMAKHDIWFRDPRKLIHNILSNPDFESGFDYVPYQEHTVGGVHRFGDLMSGNWAWRQAVSAHYHLSLLFKKLIFHLGYDC